jgi:hypothetical protein
MYRKFWLGNLKLRYQLWDSKYMRNKIKIDVRDSDANLRKKPKWEAVYHHPTLIKDGDVAWWIPHNRIVTPQQVHKWNKRDTSDCSWCPCSSTAPQSQPSGDVWTTPQLLANYLLVLAKTTCSTHQHPPDNQHMFRIRLQFGLHLELHHSLWKNDIEAFTSYWLHRNILGKMQDGRIIDTERPDLYTSVYTNCIQNTVYNYMITFYFI